MRFDDKKLLQIMKLYEDTFAPRLVPTRIRWKRWQGIVPQVSQRFGARDIAFFCLWPCKEVEWSISLDALWFTNFHVVILMRGGWMN